MVAISRSELQPQPPHRSAGVRPFRLTREAALRLMRSGIINEGSRVQLIEGELVEFDVQGTPHATSVGLAQDALTALFGSGYVVRVQLPLAVGEYSLPEPDLVVARGTRRDYFEEHPTVANVVVVLEIADSTLPFDQGEKASMYARGGLQDLWILNLVHRQLEVYRDPQPDASARFGWHYRTKLIIASDGEVAPLAAPDRAVRLTDLVP